MVLRQPIVAVMGHVDHGKTSILDAIRKTNVAKKEAGAITQHIGASEISLADIKQACSSTVGSRLPDFTIPGLLFIDTPGHESFTHLRERGGSIADIAVLVVDITQGFQPQTVESIKILKEFKTPFVVAANKLDLVSGWKSSGKCGIVEAIGLQREDVQTRVDEMLYGLVGKLHERGIESERFDRITDFTKQVAIIPVSATRREGLAELLLSVAGLSQKFLEKELKTEVGGIGKGSVLEVKEEKGLGTTMDVIIYEGTLKKNDTIFFGTINGSAKAKIRGVLKPKLKPKADGDKFEYVDKVHAAAGVKLYAPGLEAALPGSPIVVDDKNPKTDQLKEINDLIKGILSESESMGIIVKADTIGSIEAVRKLLTAQKVQVKRAGVGNVVKKDIVDASVVRATEPYLGVVLAFNVGVAEDANAEAAKKCVKLFSSDVIYSLCEDYAAWVEEQKKIASGAAIERLPSPAKLLVLPSCTFRESKPAIFGVQVAGGRLKKGIRLMDKKGKIIGQVREIQKDGKPVQEAKHNEELAISVEGAICGKTFIENDYLFTYITRKEADELLSSCSEELGEDGKAALEEILSITDKSLI